jgi:hypothetical protein
MLALIPFLECPEGYTLLPREKGAEFKVPRPLGEGFRVRADRLIRSVHF